MTDPCIRLEGSANPQTIWDFYRMERTPCVATTEEELATVMTLSKPALDNVDVRNPATQAVLQVLQQNQAIERVSFELVQKLASLGLTQANILFNPQLMAHQALSQMSVTEAVIAGVGRALAAQKNPMKIHLTLSLYRGANQSANAETIEVARRFIGTMVHGLDITGPEKNHPLSLFRHCLTMASLYGIPFSVHAGLTDAPEDILEAIDLGAQTIIHGNCLSTHPELFDALQKANILVISCPSAELGCAAIKHVSDIPLKALREKGIRVAIAASDMTSFATDTQKEYGLVKNAFAFTEDEMSSIVSMADTAFITQK